MKREIKYLRKISDDRKNLRSKKIWNNEKKNGNKMKDGQEYCSQWSKKLSKIR